MIVYFNTLSPVKKEASFLRKLIKKHIQDSIASLTDVQDIVASMYGWKNYNRLSQSHDEMVSQLSNKFGDINYMKIHNIKTINILEPMERRALEVQKRVNLSESLNQMSKNKNGIEATVYEFFDRKSKVYEFFGLSLHSSELERVKRLSSLPTELWKGHSLFYSNNFQDISRFVIDVPLAQAIIGGGTFVLRESVANEVFYAIHSILDDKSRLKSFYVGDKAYFNGKIHPSSCRFDPLSVGTWEHENATRIGHAFEHKSNDPGQKSWSQRATALYRLMYEEKITIKELLESISSIDNIYKKATHTYLNSKNDNKKYEFCSVMIEIISPLLHTKMFVENDISELSSREKEDLGYSAMIACEQLKELIEAPAVNDIYVDIMDCFYGNSINIFVIPDYSCINNENYDSLITSTFRMMLAPALGYMAESPQGSNFICKKQDKQVYKPFFLDASINLINIKGLSVVAAQYRTLGVAMFYCLNDSTLNSEFNDRLEENSRFANTLTKIYTGIDFASQITKDIERNFCAYLDIPPRIDKIKKQSAIQLVQGKTVFIYKSGVFYTEE